MKKPRLRLKLLAILLVLSVATPVVAQEIPKAINLKAATLIPVEGPAQTVTGGVWLSDEQAFKVAKIIEPHNEKLKEDHSESSPVTLVAVGLGLGLLGGFVLGVSL